MTLLDGKYIARTIRQELAQEVKQLLLAGQRAPHLAVVMVGDNPASQTYVNNKLKACAEVGFEASLVALPATITQAELLQQIDLLNHDDRIDGFLVQLPLPEHLDEHEVSCAIDWHKDVDGLHPQNVGRTALGMPSILSATPRGIRELLLRYNIETESKHIVVVGRSNIVGKPMAMTLFQKGFGGNATVTVCHSFTRNLASICRTADILIVAVGHPGLITEEMVKESATVVDVGINRVTDDSARGYHLCGDVDFEHVAPHCAFITPVPGGVGPMTIASLLQNTLQAYRQRQAL